MSAPDQRRDALHTILSWMITPPYIILFISILVLFHPLQRIGSWFGRRAQKRVLDTMNIAIIWNIRIVTGARFRYVGHPTIPPERPVILVSNHQSMYDIPMIMWACRAREVGFIAKKELGRWIPSISFALRTLGSVLIDRKDAKGSIRAIEAFGMMKEERRQVAAIFPEGTRARDGIMKEFRASGFNALLRSMPSAIIQPVAIRGNWSLLKYNFFPVPFGTSIEVGFLPPIEQSLCAPDELLSRIRERIQERTREGNECSVG
jgi:1-acyl-sn-glycerol-3-phosphate acyltransferase